MYKACNMQSMEYRCRKQKVLDHFIATNGKRMFAVTASFQLLYSLDYNRSEL